MMIRQAQQTDIPEIFRIRLSVKENRLLDADAISAELITDYLHNRGCGWVAVSDKVGEPGLQEHLTGFAIADYETQSVWALFVDPEHEGQGVGRALHDEVIAWFRGRGARRIKLGTEPGSRAAGFYTSAGWQFQHIDSDGEAIFYFEF